MRLIAVAFMFGFYSIAAHADTNLQNVAIRISAGFDQFAACAASTSLKLSSSDDSVFSLVSVEAPSVAGQSGKLAKLKFLAKKPSGSFSKYELSFFSDEESDGFLLVQAANGEIYPFSTTIERSAMLVSQPKGFVLGVFDISKCKIN